MRSFRAVGLQPYRGELRAFDAASGIQAARLNARALLESSQLLLNERRYAHAIALAVLADEEAAKGMLIMGIFLGVRQPADAWKDYRSHTAKTAHYNFAIESRAHAEFGPLSDDLATAAREGGPTPEIMDATKQLSLYSDCFADGEQVAWHLPANWATEEFAVQVVNETIALVTGLRDYPPDELEVWRQHWDAGRTAGSRPESVVRRLHDELLARGMIKQGQWDPVLRALENAGT